MDWYNLLRGLHILAVMAWMAGLLYLPRLFIYHIKNRDVPQVTEVFNVMERNLLRLIMNPAMIVAWVFGLGLVWIDSQTHGFVGFLTEPWFMVKMAGIVLITGYHHFLALRFKKLQRGEDIGTERFWRMMNELPFVLAIIMVLSVTLEYCSH